MRYTQREPVTAAQYEAGKPLNELLAVAKLANYYATVTEVTDWQVVLVRTYNSDDEQYAYLVVEDRGWLVYGSPGWKLHALDDDRFRDAYQEAESA